MDPLSQAVVGALAGGVTALAARKPEYLRAGFMVGAIGGLVPDLDIVLRSASDPLMGLKYHRHFTHALLLAPVVGLFAAPLGWLALWLWGRTIPTKGWLWLLATVGVATHGPLDALTNYGTHLFWPLTERRENWNIISIIDPVFTLTLFVVLIAAAVKRSARLTVAALIFAAGYFTLGTAQHWRAVSLTQDIAASRGHVPVRVMVNPTLGNQLAWRLVYEVDGKMYADGAHLGLASRIYEGSSAPLFRLPQGLLPASSQQAQDYAYFNFFADDWMVASRTEPLAIRDARFAGLPTDIGGFWGVRINPATPDRHIERVNFDGRDTRQWPLLKAMILGQDLPPRVE